MSAWLCSDYHINAMVTYGAAHEAMYCDWRGDKLKVKGNEQKVATLLLRANEASLLARYDDKETHEIFYEETGLRSAVEIIAACNCFDYQACEVEDYELTVAWRITRAIVDSALRHLPGYGAAPWGLDQPESSTNRRTK